MPLSRSARLGAVATAAASFFVIAASSGPGPGADGVGDSYFPQLGNGGYDARHYALDLAYDPDTDRLDGRTTLTALATQNLSSFDLDLQKLEVTKVEVNGRRAQFTREGDEIRITPRGSCPRAGSSRSPSPTAAYPNRSAGPSSSAPSTAG